MKKAREIIEKFAIGERLAVGVSGGVDSMTLLHLLLTTGRLEQFNVTVIHVDHNLRETSMRDRAFVESFCKEKNIEIKVFEPDILSMAKENKRSIETEARIYRNEVFKSFCEKNNASLLLAHTADDNAETILMHIFRGCGIDGLCGMSEFDTVYGIKIIRPLITTAKSEIYDYARANDIKYFEDETNTDLQYNRNFVRNLFIQIESRYPAAIMSINRLSRLATVNQNHIYSTLNPSFFREQDDIIILKKDALKTELAAYYVIFAAKKAGLKTDLDSTHIAAILSLDKSGKKIELPHGIIAYCERNEIAFTFCQAIKVLDEVPFSLGKVRFDDDLICTSACEAVPKKGEIRADMDKLDGTVIRTRRESDYFHACGGFNKKLKKYFSEKGVYNFKKDQIPLICRGREVLVVVGIELSDKVKITSETKNAVRIHVEKA